MEKGVITKQIRESLKIICLEISERHEIHFLEIGYEPDYVYFLLQMYPQWKYLRSREI
ncbi:MAG: transposase [Candidatus Marinimicrobia bacterium]|nr:transposase [Candidatus Neomarinimicrobiota bacterium]